MFKEMTNKELLDFCRWRFCDYDVCKALDCEDNCINEDCPLVQFFDRMERLIDGEDDLK